MGRGRDWIQAVDDISISLAPGEALGVTGPSGCGKTTLLRMLLGLLKPDSGTVERRVKAGFVGQDPYTGLCPSMTVARIVAEPLIFSGQKRRWRDCLPQVEEALSLVRLEGGAYLGRFPAQLSGGERQRVAIARAIIDRPGMLLLDEPTSMLDQEIKDEIANLIRDIAAQRGAAFLMVTHDLLLAARVCGRICVMDGGKIIEEGVSQEILSAPKAPLTRDLLRIGSDVRAYWDEVYQ